MPCSCRTAFSRFLSLLCDEEERFRAEMRTPPAYGRPDSMRGVSINDYLYMVGTNAFRVERVFAE